MSISPGARLGPYDILSPLGAGGMGEVYRAKDTKLGRDVALKILPATFTNDPERVARFRREAQVLASLNHPHIAQIYGLEEANGTQFLVLELVDGESLDKRIARGKIPVDEALGIAKQIAEALEAAHEKGIIHRDLKPANIALTADGNVKVLDFGLAKATEAASGTNSVDVTNSPTITTPAMMTGIGVILGTAAYMSPEQVRGMAADKRSDVWAFGCVLFEMLTGQRACVGEHVSDVMAAVLRAEPDWTALPPALGPNLRTILKGCLDKNRHERIADLSTVRFLFHQSQGAQRSQRQPTGTALVVTAAAALLIGALITFAVVRTPGSDRPPVTRFTVQLPGERLAGYASPLLALTPDGRRLAFISNQHLYVQQFDRLDADSVPGTDGAQAPFFSPDGQWVGFWQAGVVKKVPVTGGPALRICDVPRSPSGFSVFAGTWTDDDRIVFTGGGAGVWRVSASGGTAESLITLKDGETAFGPQMLPDHNRVLFTVNPGGLWDRAQIVVQRLDTGARQVVVPAGRDGRYLAT